MSIQYRTQKNRTYTIKVHNVTNAGENRKLHDGTIALVPLPSEGPRTAPGTNPTIHMPATGGSAFEFGAFDAKGKPFKSDNWRILAHELCGHGLVNAPGRAPRSPPTSATTKVILVENLIAGEHGEPARGLFGSLRDGESYHRLLSEQELVFTQKDGLHYEKLSIVRGRVTASALRVRTQPRLTAPVVGLISRGTVVSIKCKTSGDAVEGNSDWFQTPQGFMSGQFITIVSGGPAPNC